MNRGKGQTTVEYVVLLAGMLIVVVLVTLLIRGSIFNPAQDEINASAATIKGFASALR
ncbi:TPA: class III signal peptide-containing protein [Candidatus Micrarchaeota archaeon]|nr:class III signal peptide-containing protein [Candidatus Micrarchaeota archaeon]